MHPIRASAVPVRAMCIGLAFGAALSGCASSRLSSQLPPGVRLAGDWKLDSTRSDDLGTAVQQLRLQGERSQRNRRERRGGGATQIGEPAEGESPAGPEGGPGIGVGPMPRFSPVNELMSHVPQGDYLRIGVSADAFTVTSGDASSQYTPGQEADISAEQGDAQQTSGWKGTAYVIDTRPQWGPEIIQSYDLTKDGRLVMTLRLAGDGTKFTFTRIYDRTNRVAPLAPPSLN